MLTGYWKEFRSIPQLPPLVLLLLAVPLIFYSSTLAMARVWIVNETFTHGFVILPISLWLIWLQRHAIASTPMAIDLRALFFVLPALALWVIATLINVDIVQQLVMVALIPLIVWLLLGLPLTLALLFPLLYLFFAVPLGESLIPPMMELTADFTVYMVQLTGIPIYRDGLSFELPSGSWSVVEECSGVRYLIASAALGTIYAYMTYSSARKRAVFILASLIVPIVANGFRAYGIVMIGHYSGMTLAVGADHLLYGWVFFGIVIFLLFWIGGFWADSPLGQPENATDTTSRHEINPPRRGVVVMVLAGLLAMNIAINARMAQDIDLPTHAEFQLPLIAGDWQQLTDEVVGERWQPILNNPDLSVHKNYRRGRELVALDLGYYIEQREGKEAISSLNRLSDPYGGDWKLIASRSYSPGNVQVREAELIFAERKVLVWQIYRVGDRYISNPYLAKIYQALQILVGQRQAAFITISTPFDEDLATLRVRLAAAWQALSVPVSDAATAVVKAG